MKNIIFDLGGVIVDIDYSKTIVEFQKLGVKSNNAFFTQKSQSLLCDDFEEGKISADEFRKKLQQELCFTTDQERFDKAWSALLLDVKPEKLQFLKKLREKGYKLFLLSNTNQIHITSFHHYLQQTFAIPDLQSYFDKVYYSHEIKLRKPSPEIFNFVITENQLSVSETLFIDDTLQHIEGAKAVGLQTMLHPQNSNLSLDKILKV